MTGQRMTGTYDRPAVDLDVNQNSYPYYILKGCLNSLDWNGGMDWNSGMGTGMKCGMEG